MATQGQAPATDGVILVDKPAGKTSHDVVAAVRRQLGRGIKVGHAGTLDPFATGLLLVLVGRATRVQRFVMALPKRYETVARLGWTSTTGDRDGELAPGRMPAEPFVLPTGVLRQRPPAFSAIKVGGVRAYERARRGEAVELAEREVRVERFDLLWHREDHAAFAIECSAGTYVRSLISDLSDAYCTELRRTEIGAFDVAQADPERIVALEDAIDFLPQVQLSLEDGRRAAFGQTIAGSAEAVANVSEAVGRHTQSVVRLVDPDGLVALAEPRVDGSLKPVVGFRS